MKSHPCIEFEVEQHIADDAAGILIDQGAKGAEIVENERDGKVLVRVWYDPGDTDLPVFFKDTVCEAKLLLAQNGIQLDGQDFRTNTCSDADWQDQWKAFFKPLELGKSFLIVPSWHNKPEMLAQHHQDLTKVILDPGMAFGTGQHETTALCAELLESYLSRFSDATKRNMSFLDVGCGSGILCFVASRLGVGRVLGIDNDPIAIQVACENAATNQLEHSISFELADTQKKNERFDCIVANILAETLENLSPFLIRSLKREGFLILSGVLEEQTDALCRVFLDEARKQKQLGFKLIQTRQKGQWMALEWQFLAVGL